MKTRKFILGTIIASVAISSSLSLLAGADNYEKAIDSKNSKSMDSYLKETLEPYAEACNISGNCNFSNEFTVVTENNEQFYVRFIMSDNHIIGTLLLSDNNDEIVSTLILDNAEKFDDAYQNKQELAFVKNNDDIYFNVEGNDEAFAFNECEVKYNTSYIMTDESKNSQVIDYKKIENDENYKSYSESNISVLSTTSKKKMLDVPVVKNGTNSDNPKGLCWAAAIASMDGYYNNKGIARYSCYKIYDFAKALHPNMSPVIGTNTVITDSFKHLFINAVYKYQNYSGNEAYKLLNSNWPLYVVMQKSATDKSSHAIVIAGIEINSSGTGMYKVIDSNYNKPVYSYITTSAMTNGDSYSYLTNSGTNYNIWSRTWY